MRNRHLAFIVMALLVAVYIIVFIPSRTANWRELATSRAYEPVLRNLYPILKDSLSKHGKWPTQYSEIITVSGAIKASKRNGSNFISVTFQSRQFEVFLDGGKDGVACSILVEKHVIREENNHRVVLRTNGVIDLEREEKGSGVLCRKAPR